MTGIAANRDVRKRNSIKRAVFILIDQGEFINPFSVVPHLWGFGAAPLIGWKGGGMLWMIKEARALVGLNTHGRHSVLCRDQVETTLPAVTTLQRFATRFVFKVPQHQQHLFTNWNQHTTNHPQPPLFLMNDHMSGSSIIHFSPYGDFGQFHVSDLTIIESRTSCYILSF